MRRLLTIVLLMLAVTPGLAVNPDEVLQDKALEARARAISANLRCLVCQNQSIDDSDAGLARDLRLIVRERLTAGDSDAEVFDYVVSRYGNFVLLKPPLQLDTVVLWAAPAVLLFVAFAGFIRFVRKARIPAEDEAPLGDEERRRLDELEKTIS
jgi:cytochrome c-type biogenesis protein CcmH